MTYFFAGVPALRTAARRIAKDASLGRLLSNSGWVLSANGVIGITALVQGVLLTRALGVQQFGIFSLIVTFVSVLNQLTSFRMGEFVVKYVSGALAADRSRDAGLVIKIALVAEACASVVAFAAVWVLAPLGQRLFIEAPDGASLIRIYSAVIIANAITETLQGTLHSLDRFRLYAIFSATRYVVSLVAVAAALFANGGVEGVLWGLVGAATISSAAGGVLVARVTRSELGRGWSSVRFSEFRGRWRGAVNFTLSTNVGATLSLVTKESDVLWLGLFRNSAEVAFYKLAVSLMSALMMPVAPLAQAVYPMIARYAAVGEWRRFSTTLRRTSALAAAYLVPMIMVAAFLGESMIHFVYGSDFAPAWPALAVILVGAGYANVLFWSRPSLLALDRADFAMKVNAGMAGLKVIGILAIVPAWGYVGNAALLAALYIVGVTISAWKVVSTVRQNSAREATLLAHA